MSHPTTLPRLSDTDDITRAQPKVDTVHDEDIGVKEAHLDEKVVDSYAAGYTDTDLVIDEAENKRLRRMINTRWVSSAM